MPTSKHHLLLRNTVLFWHWKTDWILHLAWDGHGPHDGPNSLSRYPNHVSYHSNATSFPFLLSIAYSYFAIPYKEIERLNHHPQHSEKTKTTWFSPLKWYTHTHTHTHTHRFSLNDKFTSNVKIRLQKDDIQEYKMKTLVIFCGFKIFHDFANHLIILRWNISLNIPWSNNAVQLWSTDSKVKLFVFKSQKHHLLPVRI